MYQGRKRRKIDSCDVPVEPWRNVCDLVCHWTWLIKLCSIGSMPVCNDRPWLNAKYVARKTGKLDNK